MVCPRCLSSHIMKAGKKATVKYGKKQRYQCAECAHTFYQEKEISK